MQNFLVVGLGKFNKHSCYSFELAFITWVNLLFKDLYGNSLKTWTDLQLKRTKCYEDLKNKQKKSANDITKLTINDCIMLHRKTNKELKNWTKTDDHKGIQCNILQCVRSKFQFFIKVVEHSFRAHKDYKNKNVVNRAIILFIQNPHLLRYFSLLLNAVYWCLYSVIIKIS